MSALRDALRDLSEDVFFDLLESDDAYLLVVDVPGVTADSIDVTVEEGTLSIDGRREKDREIPGEYQYIEENRSLFFDVSLPVPDDAVAGNAQSRVERGVLELTLPKRTGGETTIEVTDDSVSNADSASASERDADTASGIDADEPTADDADAEPR
ncbi:Hsp20/alpha crystallin family protein [Halobiforma nitratireducens]|uniref:Heat shock protein Hsp20 n=1 Tax=Halobiforma nitratireducens JCM 10879 TaxID=1227454 RepID=M0L301_9EURY|nr:Hsp20/alpha crystallin family protein [Halobiforma nitratireducens]EMA27468.1 heat shock protein Hsp20 [Halobiforma nitratireducens JCM 10879]